MLNNKIDFKKVFFKTKTTDFNGCQVANINGFIVNR